MKKKKFAFVFGTRPEIIKLSPLIKLCQKKKVPFFCVHTGQHYSYKLDRIFFKELDLPTPKYNLHIRSKAPIRQGDHTGRMLIKIEDILLKELPSCVITQGDTNSALAGILTAEKITTTKEFSGLVIKTAHVEAGLRSFDRRMPEETNRIITDHFADFLFAPTMDEKKLLLKEGIPQSHIHITGNTIVDAIKHMYPLAKKQSKILQSLQLDAPFYILLTLHRQENVNTKRLFASILQGLSNLRKKLNLPIVFPIHPRTLKLVKDFKLKLPKTLQIIEPLGYLDFLMLQANAALVLTDSGGVQEESCTLKIPCVTLRDNTERPQTVHVGANIISGTNASDITKACTKMLKSKRQWKNPLGNGNASNKILTILLRDK